MTFPPEPRAPSELDLGVLAGILQGYLRYAVAQQDRARADGREPPVVEGNAHNEFLSRRALYPGLHRHVARAMDIDLYRRQLETLAAAAVTTALRERPTREAWAQALGHERVDATIDRYLRRVTQDYLADAIRIEGAADDERERTIASVFSPQGAAGPDDFGGHAVDVDLEAWKTAKVAKFTDPFDWVAVSSALLAAYPEQLRAWTLVQRAVLRATRNEPVSPARATLRHPIAIALLANHGMSILASRWWQARSEATKKDLLRTPRIFQYDEADAEEAVQLWMDLARVNPAWAEVAPHDFQLAGLALKRWGAESQAALLTRQAAALPGLSKAARAAFLSNAGTFYRGAARLVEAQACYRQAMVVLDADPYQAVVVRVNLAEVLGGPTASREAADLLQEAIGRAVDDRGRAAFWRNATTMFHRLGDETREEAALDAFLPLLSASPGSEVSARRRFLQLQASRRLQRPMAPLDAIRFAGPSSG